MYQFILSLIVGAIIGGVAGYLGTLMISKREALVAGALGHTTIPGIALALIYGFDISLGAFLILSMGALLIWLFQIRTEIPTEALTGIMFAFFVSLGFLLLPKTGISLATLGDISKVGMFDGMIAILLSFIILFIIKYLYPKMTLIGLSFDIARIEGIHANEISLLYLFSLSLLISYSVRIVGGLLTAALFVIPAATSRNLSKSLSQYKRRGFVVGSLSAITGITLYKLLGYPAGPLIIIVSTIFFLISLFFRG